MFQMFDVIIIPQNKINRFLEIAHKICGLFNRDNENSLNHILAFLITLKSH